MLAPTRPLGRRYPRLCFVQRRTTRKSVAPSRKMSSRVGPRAFWIGLRETLDSRELFPVHLEHDVRRAHPRARRGAARLHFDHQRARSQAVRQPQLASSSRRDFPEGQAVQSVGLGRRKGTPHVGGLLIEGSLQRDGLAVAKLAGGTSAVGETFPASRRPVTPPAPGPCAASARRASVDAATAHRLRALPRFAHDRPRAGWQRSA